jgi:hypothetical protein
MICRYCQAKWAALQELPASPSARIVIRPSVSQPAMNLHPPHKSRYLDPKTDLAFKLVFANDVELLKSFLNALLPLPGDAQIEGGCGL